MLYTAPRYVNVWNETWCIKARRGNRDGLSVERHETLGSRKRDFLLPKP